MGLLIKNYCLLCNQGSSSYNEDIVGFNTSGAWVLDGATGLNGKNLVSETTDARWYVNWWNKYLYENINKDLSLKEIILDGLDLIKKDYNERLGDIKVEKIDFPSSSIAVVKFHEKSIEYFMLGDCTLFVKNGENKIIKDRTICKFDSLVFDKMIDIVKVQNRPFSEVRGEVQSLLIENRLRKNTENGYWILDFEKEVVSKAIHGYIEIENNSTFILASDGFTSACDRYGIYTEDEILEVAEKYGVEHIYNQVRGFEEKDSNAMKIPRFKIKDDSSCIYLNLDIE